MSQGHVDANERAENNTGLQNSNKNTLQHLCLSADQKLLAKRLGPARKTCKRRRKADETRAVGIQNKLDKSLKFSYHQTACNHKSANLQSFNSAVVNGDGEEKSR